MTIRGCSTSPRLVLAAHRTATQGAVCSVCAICHLSSRLCVHVSGRSSGIGTLRRSSGFLSGRLCGNLSSSGTLNGSGSLSGRSSSLGGLRSRLDGRLTTIVEPHNCADQPYERRQESCANHGNHVV